MLLYVGLMYFSAFSYCSFVLVSAQETQKPQTFKSKLHILQTERKVLTLHPHTAYTQHTHNTHTTHSYWVRSSDTIIVLGLQPAFTSASASTSTSTPVFGLPLYLYLNLSDSDVPSQAFELFLYPPTTGQAKQSELLWERVNFYKLYAYVPLRSQGKPNFLIFLKQIVFQLALR